MVTETRTTDVVPVAGVLLSAPCKEMLKSIDIEAKAITRGVSECLEKELSSDGQNDMDIAAMHELEVLAQRAKMLCEDAALLAPVLPPDLGQLGDELRAHSEYVRTLRSEVQGRVFARREKAYSAVLADHHQIVPVPADGNCFFWAAVVARDSQNDGRNVELQVAHARKMIVSNCLHKVHALRSCVCQYMRDNISSLKQDIIEACLEALSQQSASALRSNLIEQLGACIQLQTSGSWDGSEHALCTRARESLQSTVNTTEETGLEACEIYCRTFDSPGVFAERLHVQCLSDLWDRSIKLFYYTGGEKTPAKGAAVAPTELFCPSRRGARDPCESCNNAISMLHYPSARHFDVMFEQSSELASQELSRDNPEIRPLNMPLDNALQRDIVAGPVQQGTKRRSSGKVGKWPLPTRVLFWHHHTYLGCTRPSICTKDHHVLMIL